MKSKNLRLVWKAEGYLDSQLIKNYLESFGIPVYDFEESIGKAYGFTTVPLGEVEIYVPFQYEEVALRQLNLLLCGESNDTT